MSVPTIKRLCTSGAAITLASEKFASVLVRTFNDVLLSLAHLFSQFFGTRLNINLDEPSLPSHEWGSTDDHPLIQNLMRVAVHI